MGGVGWGGGRAMAMFFFVTRIAAIRGDGPEDAATEATENTSGPPVKKARGTKVDKAPEEATMGLQWHYEDVNLKPVKDNAHGLFLKFLPLSVKMEVPYMVPLPSLVGRKEAVLTMPPVPGMLNKDLVKIHKEAAERAAKTRKKEIVTASIVGNESASASKHGAKHLRL